MRLLRPCSDLGMYEKPASSRVHLNGGSNTDLCSFISTVLQASVCSDLGVSRGQHVALKVLYFQEFCTLTQLCCLGLCNSEWVSGPWPCEANLANMRPPQSPLSTLVYSQANLDHLRAP